MISDQELKKREELWELGYWEIPDGLDVSHFNFTWRPYKHDRPYIHQFGTQWQKTGGPKFIIPNNEGVKYQNFQHAIKLPDNNNRCWRPLISNIEFDFSWHPDETNPPYIYVFGNQWYDSNTMPTLLYRVKGATDKKYITDINCRLLPNKTKWNIPDDIEDDFDYSWIPHPTEPPLIWQFGTQWQKTGGPQFIAEGATVLKYSNELVAKHKPSVKKFRIIEPVDSTDFDFSWHPDSTEEPYNYVFGNDIHSYEKMPTLVYKNKNAVGTKYIDHVKPKLKIEEVIIEDSIFDTAMKTNLDYKFNYFGTKSVDFRHLLKDDEQLTIMHIIVRV